MKIKLRKKKGGGGGGGVLGVWSLVHDLHRNEHLIGLGKEPVFFETTEIPTGARRLNVEICGYLMRFTFIGGGAK